ncbi:hypothetical protein ACHAWF_002301 [Thalassiosira exigua]
MSDISLSTTVGVVAASAVLVLLSRSRSGGRSSPAHSPPSSAVLITGGGRGIGKSCADRLLSLGYRVFVTVRKESQYAEMEADAKGDAGAGSSPRAHPVLLDVSNDDHISSAVERVQSLLKSLDCKLVAIVNNAGINPEGDEMSEAYADGGTPKNFLANPSVATRVLATNVVGVARITRAFLPLVADGGWIINSRKGRSVSCVLREQQVCPGGSE